VDGRSRPGQGCQSTSVTAVRQLDGYGYDRRCRHPLVTQQWFSPAGSSPEKSTQSLPCPWSLDFQIIQRRPEDPLLTLPPLSHRQHTLPLSRQAPASPSTSGIGWFCEEMSATVARLRLSGPGIAHARQVQDKTRRQRLRYPGTFLFRPSSNSL
jgi:hypothetical protein